MLRDCVLRFVTLCVVFLTTDKVTSRSTGSVCSVDHLGLLTRSPGHLLPPVGC